MIDVVSVIGGGWSFEEVDHDKVQGYTIGVNDALVAWQGSRPLDVVISMDRLWTEHRWPHILQRQMPTYLRDTSGKRVSYGDHTWIRSFVCDTDRPTALTTDERQLNGRSSGAVGVALAYTLRPRTLFLFGFDMGLSPAGKAHWYAPYPWSKGPKGNTGSQTYRNWVTDFTAYRAYFDAIETKVYNVSPRSSITAFTRVSAQDIGCSR